MNLKEAITKGIGAHGMWKQRLLEAIKSGQSEWSPVTVCKDDQCEFGKWLYSCSAQDKASTYFERVKSLHSEFHKEAAEVLRLALAGKKQEATTAIAFDSNYGRVSSHFIREMMNWQGKAA